MMIRQTVDVVEDKVRDVSYEFTIDSDELTLERKEKRIRVYTNLRSRLIIVTNKSWGGRMRKQRKTISKKSLP